MQILVNEKFVDALIDRKTKRLFNKSFSFKRPQREETFWNLGDGIWLTFFSPDFNTDVSIYGVNEKDPYTYLLDITDLLKEKGQNYLYIRNLYSKIKEIEYKTELPLYAKVEIVQKDIEKEEKTDEKIQLKGKPKLEILEKGGIKINFENTSILLESVFSYPYGGFNKLGKEIGKDNEKDWKIEVKKKYPI